MKKYVKPALYFESFELNRHIADCAFEFTNSKKMDECAAKSDPNFYFEEVMYFMSGVADCTVPVEDPESYCYTNGNPMFGLFMS